MSGVPDDLTIGEVSALLGVPVPTLRSWHLRYGVAQPQRTAGGHRRYARTDVAVLQALSGAVARGIAPRSAAQALSAPVSDLQRPVELLSRLLEHVDRGDQPGAVAVLDEGEATLGLEPAVHRLLTPALQEVGRRWEVGAIDVGSEHLATAAARRWIATRAGTPTARQATAPVLLAAAVGNAHTVALEAFAMVLDRRGWPTRQLGADTPTAAVLSAVERTGAQAVVLTAHQVSLRRGAVHALRALRAQGRTRLYYAGAAFESPGGRREVPGQYLGTALPEAADMVEAGLA